MMTLLPILGRIRCAAGLGMISFEVARAQIRYTEAVELTFATVGLALIQPSRTAKQ
jgi:hypothetical protein